MDLRTDSVTQYWASHIDKSLNEFLKRMKNLEDWAMDNEAPIADLLFELGNDLEKPEARERLLAKSPKETIELMAWLCSPTTFALLEMLENEGHEALPRLLKLANDNKDNVSFTLFVDRLTVLARAKLIASVFSPQRLMLVEAAVRAAGHSEENR